MLTSDVILNEISNEFRKLTKKPEKFLSGQPRKLEQIRSLIKVIYDFTKSHELKKDKSDALPQLIIENFDEEQIWQELELQNNAKCNQLVAEVAHLIAKVDRLQFFDKSGKEKVEDSAEESSDDDDDEEEESDVDEQDLSLSEESRVYSDEETEKRNLREIKPKQYKPTVVDDTFFKLNEMEEYMQKLEQSHDDEKSDSEESVDYFEDVSSESDASVDEKEETKQPYYSDFFDDPLVDDEGQHKRKNLEEDNESDARKTKRVKFVLEDERENEKDVEEDSSSEISGEATEENVKNDNKKSNFELRQERLKSRIKSLEEEALKEKPWQLKGEVSGTTRPQNSLLEEYVEFDLTTRPAPIITEQTSLKLEDIIKQRIKDKVWDDVVRKIKPVEEPHEYKKKLILDQEKSKLSLAAIYEEEYIKQRDALLPEAQEKPEEIPPEHTEIQNMMNSLFVKLDALSNFHYTPKPIAPDIKIVSNLPAISMEEVAPVAASDATLLAPEEIKAKSKGEIIGKTERTTTDKKRERRQKKVRQREREKQKQKKLIDKLNPGLGNKYSKEKRNKMIEKAVKEGNVSQMHETQDLKSLKSSQAFFSQLNDEVISNIKAKTKKDDARKQHKKFDAKKLKI